MSDLPSPWAPRPPTRAEVEERFCGVLDGTLTRHEADRWAAQWVAAPGDPGIDDEVVWEGLDRLFGIGGPDLSGGFLFSEELIAEWLAELRRAS